jgi:hypothetical protein
MQIWLRSPKFTNSCPKISGFPESFTDFSMVQQKSPIHVTQFQGIRASFSFFPILHLLHTIFRLITPHYFTSLFFSFFEHWMLQNVLLGVTQFPSKGSIETSFSRCSLAKISSWYCPTMKLTTLLTQDELTQLISMKHAALYTFPTTNIYQQIFIYSTSYRNQGASPSIGDTDSYVIIRKLLDTVFNILLLGNSKKLTQDFSSIRLPTQNSM